MKQLPSPWKRPQNDPTSTAQPPIDKSVSLLERILKEAIATTSSKHGVDGVADDIGVKYCKTCGSVHIILIRDNVPFAIADLAPQIALDLAEILVDLVTELRSDGNHART